MGPDFFFIFACLSIFVHLISGTAKQKQEREISKLFSTSIFQDRRLLRLWLTLKGIQGVPLYQGWGREV